MFDVDARADLAETDYLLSRAARRRNLELARALDASAERALGEVDAREAILAIAPHLREALAVALAKTSAADQEISLRQAADMIGRPARALARLCRENASPIPFTRRDGRHPRFRRADVDAFLAGDLVAAPAGVVRELAAAIERALPNPRGDRRALMSTEQAGRRLLLTPARLRSDVARGRSPAPPVRIGRKLFFRLADVEAAARAAHLPTVAATFDERK